MDTGDFLLEYINDVNNSKLNGPVSRINADWTSVVGPEGDKFLAQTGVLTHSILIPDGWGDVPVQLGIGVFDLKDRRVPSALLIDDIKLNGVILGGLEDGDFESDPLGGGGFFHTDGGPAGLFELKGAGSFSSMGVDEPGTDSDYFAYISTYNGPLSSVPVPGAVWLFGSALLALLGIRRRFRN